MSQAFTPLQRHVADGIVKFICRGNYDKALGTLNYMAGTFPPQEESTLRRLLKRLQRNNKTMDSLPVYKVLLQELPDVDANLIRRMDTHIPHEVLGEIYDQMHSQDFEQFQVQLEHLQRVEYNVMRHTLILYEHCTKLKAAQRALDKHHLMSGICLELRSFILNANAWNGERFFVLELALCRVLCPNVFFWPGTEAGHMLGNQRHGRLATQGKSLKVHAGCLISGRYTGSGFMNLSGFKTQDNALLLP